MKKHRNYTMSARADAVVKTRERIIEAATALLFAEAYEDITLNAIAAASGVSHQTVLNHFESKEGVARAVAEVLKENTFEARYAVRRGDPADAVRVLVGEYEVFGDANARWAITAERLGSLASLIDDARASHQVWIEHVFGDALPTTPARRRRAINALHVATDVYSWKLLRRDLGLSRTDTERVMTDLVEATLRATTTTTTKHRSTP
jgi:AcrR family transcriptional regulator